MAARKDGRPPLPHVDIQTLDDLDQWLAGCGVNEGAHWLVYPRKSAFGPGLRWPDIVDVLLCHGWIDSLPRKLDDTRTMLMISPRRSGSGWSAINREKVARLMAAGRMRPGGLAVIEAAKQAGDWDTLKDADPDCPPEDLAAALLAAPGAAENFNRFPRSSRRSILEWIVSAKKPETRASRVAKTVTLAAEGRMANAPAGRDQPFSLRRNG